MMIRRAIVSALALIASAPLAAFSSTPYRVIVADRGHAINAYDSAGNLVLYGSNTFNQNFAASYASLGLTTSTDIWGVTVDQSTSEVYATTSGDNTLYHLSPNGTILITSAVTNGATTPVALLGIDWSTDGNLYAINGGTQIWKINTATSAVTLLNSAVGAVNVYDIAAGDDGYVYLAESAADRVTRWDATTGAFVNEAVSYNGGQSPPQVDSPLALDFDAANGNLSVVDVDRFPDPAHSSMTILLRHFDLAPTTTDIGPTWTVQSSVLNLNVSLVIAPDGRTFVSDYNVADTLVFDAGGTRSVFAITPNFNGTVGIDIQLLPEPASVTLLLIGGALIAHRRGRKSARAWGIHAR
jgi:WD40 repeat protein